MDCFYKKNENESEKRRFMPKKLWRVGRSMDTDETPPQEDSEEENNPVEVEPLIHENSKPLQFRDNPNSNSRTINDTTRSKSPLPSNSEHPRKGKPVRTQNEKRRSKSPLPSNSEHRETGEPVGAKIYNQ